MAEETVLDVSPVPSTELAVEVPQDAAGYDHWRQTGEIKAKAEPATAKEASAEGDEPEETAPAPEAGKKQEPKPRDNAETRLRGILADLKAAGYTPAELKTLRREAQRVEPAAPAKVEPPKVEQKTAKSDRPARPVFGDKQGETWAEFQERDSEWVAAIAENAVQNYRKQQAEEASQRELRGQVDAAKGRYGPEAEATIGRTVDTLIAADISPAVKAMINDSPVLIDLAYVIGDKPDELADFIALSKAKPTEALRRLVLMERLVQDELAKPGSTARDDTGKFLPKVPEKKTTAAPPPPTEVSSRGAAPLDDGECAAATGDFETFKGTRNRADMERLRGR